MNALLTRFALAPAALLAALAAPSAQAVNVGVSIGFSQPGVHGRIDIGRYPKPVLVQPRPVLIRPMPGPVVQPVYLWVPPGHQKHWGKHCWRYQACGAPVYFVRDDWYHGHVGKGGPRHAPQYAPAPRPPGPPTAYQPGPPTGREPVYDARR